LESADLLEGQTVEYCPILWCWNAYSLLICCGMDLIHQL